MNGDNLNNVRSEASRHFINKKRKYLRAKINELETNNKSKNARPFHRSLNEFKKGYQLRTNLITDAKDDLLADSHNFSNMWKNYISRLLNGLSH
jgi:hypothetical protein